MKLGHKDEIKFDAVYGTTTRFVLILDGEHTMTVQCDQADTDRVITILDANGDRAQATKGRFITYTKLLEGPDGSPLGTETRVDPKSVYAYVLPRLHVLLGRLLRTACPNCND